MLVTTTDTLQGIAIRAYLGLVTAHAVVSTSNIVKNFRSGIRDVGSGQPLSYTEELDIARDAAMADLKRKAERMGANALIGVTLDYEIVGESHHLIMVSMTGTAVVIDDKGTIDHHQPLDLISG